MSQSIHIGVFIDGTGNYRYNDEILGNGTQSNVAKLSKVFEKTLGNEEHHIYVSGVGTRSFEEIGFIQKNGHFKDENNHFYDPRLQAIKEGKQDIHDYYDKIPMGIGYGLTGKGVEDQVEEAFTKIQKYIKDIHDENPEAEINLDIVGFSRGAASSRALVNRLHKERITEEGSHVHINFVGVFDTVSSVGVANGDYGDDINLNLNAKSANHIVQLVAMDEKRANFRSKAMPQFDISMPGAHGDIGASYGILDNKEYYATFKNHIIHNDKVDDFIKTQREEAKAAGYDGISYDVTPLDRHNQSSVYIGYVQSREVLYGLSNVSLHKMHDEMKASGVPMTDLKVLGNVENNPQYSLTEIPQALKEHPETVSDYIHNSSVDRSRVYPTDNGFTRADSTERLAHHPEKSGQRSIDINEPEKAEHPYTLADEVNEMDKGYAYTQDTQTTIRPEDTGMRLVDTFVVNVNQLDQISTFDPVVKSQEVVDSLDLPEYDNSMDYGMDMGD